MKMTNFVVFFVAALLILIGFSTSTAQCYDVPEIYSNLLSLDGTTICVNGDFTDSYDSMLVHFYYTWTKEEPMPAHTKAKLTGIIPTGEAECGGYLELQAVVGYNDTLDAGDTLVILNVLSYRVILPGDCGSELLYRSGVEEETPVPCDSCKFAVIVSGGEKMRHWKKLLMMYKHKLANGYCPENIHALYGWVGVSREPDSLASGALDPCDKNNIRQAHQEIAHKVAECHRNGKKAKVQKLFDEHGSPGGSIYIWNDVVYGRTSLPAETLLSFQQAIIDSSSDTISLEIEDEFVECYGGSTATVLRRGLRPKGKTRIRGNSDAGTSVPAYGNDGVPWDKYLSEKLARLDAGDSYDDAVKAAQEAYRAWIISNIATKHNLAGWYRGMLACMAAGSSAVCSLQYNGNWYWANNNAANRAKFQAKIDSLVADSTEEQTNVDGSGVIFKKQKFSTYCETLAVVVPPGDQIVIEFPDTVDSTMNCGNITLWEDTASSPPPSKWVRRKGWNWNNPGSHGYTAGNNRRVITTQTGGTGRYKIHNDDHWGGYTIGVEARQESLFADTPSNITTYANASFGWTDSSGMEFNPMIVTDMWYVGDAGLEGFDLSQMPAYICPRGFGAGELQVFFGDMGDNIFWDDMELWLNIIEVPTPGQLQITVEGAEFPNHLLDISSPGIYTVHLGSMSGGGGESKHTTVAPFVDFYSDPTTGPSFGWDSWALRTVYNATVSVEDKTTIKPQKFAIHKNYPDPFNSVTLVPFDLPEQAQIRVEVLDVSGKIVSIPLAGGSFEAGRHNLKVDMSKFQSGVYFVKIFTQKYSASEKIILVK